VTDDLAAMRRSYELGELSEATLAPDWLTQLRAWLDDATAAALREPNAMTLATAGADGAPGARTVLLKGLDGRGLVFFSHRTSRKGRELAANPRASAVFPWIDLQRQVVVDGDVSLVDDADSDAYWASRPYWSQLGAAVSPQSAVVSSRAELDRAVEALAAEHPQDDPPPRPEGWGGFRIAPVSVEFWQGRRDRLHDRLRYRLVDGAWVVERLAP
jgi:pyridoxamine 5'-phosphate oxidase